MARSFPSGERASESIPCWPYRRFSAGGRGRSLPVSASIHWIGCLCQTFTSRLLSGVKAMLSGDIPSTNEPCRSQPQAFASRSQIRHCQLVINEKALAVRRKSQLDREQVLMIGRHGESLRLMPVAERPDRTIRFRSLAASFVPSELKTTLRTSDPFFCNAMTWRPLAFQTSIRPTLSPTTISLPSRLMPVTGPEYPGGSGSRPSFRITPGHRTVFTDARTRPALPAFQARSKATAWPGFFDSLPVFKLKSAARRSAARRRNTGCPW